MRRSRFFTGRPSSLVTVAISTLFAAFASGDLRADDETATLPPAVTEKVDFVKQIQPLFRKNCFSCHGAEMQEGGLRLDRRRQALQGGDNGPVIVAGKGPQSKLLIAVSGLDEDLRMPPEGEGTPLTKTQVSLIRGWIDQGANWPDSADAALAKSSHWSFQPIRRPAPPTVNGKTWLRNPIDAFVLARLEADRIAPSPEAPPEMLIRRLYIDLLGVPPTAAEVNAFLTDKRPGAYKRLVERVLESPHYGERWGRHWLDLARYADSDGYEKDRARPHAWRYREWVINALNRDLPFDQFTIQQIAGDLLGSGDVESRVATGFHRNTLHNTEGGTDKEEDRVKKTVDRTNTVGAIWLGLTVGCAQCHSHKYDPFTQREYFSLYSFFNNIDEKDIPAPLPKDATKYAAAKAAFDEQSGKLQRAIEEYRREQLPAAARKWASTAELGGGWTTLKPIQQTSKHGAKLATQDDNSTLVSGENTVSDLYTIEAAMDEPGKLSAIRLEVLPDKSLVKNGPGRHDNGNFVLTTFSATFIPAPDKGEAFGIVFDRAESDYAQKGWTAALALNDNREDGWAVGAEFGKRHVAVFFAETPLEFAAGQRLRIKLDQNYNRAAPHNIGRFRLSFTSAENPLIDGVSDELVKAVETAQDKRTPAQEKLIQDHFAKLDKKLAAKQKALQAHQKTAPKASAVLAQSTVEAGPRETRIHVRGDFLSKGDKVETATPAVLPPLTPRGERLDRRDLAEWLVEESNPLTARVTVNRIWQRYFGVGLVGTSDDFGTQGEAPSHPLLLDWLASQLRDGGWKLKQLHRLIVNSATYRQSSATRPELIEKDPQNRLLARQSRRRVEAEIVRDLALAASGLLDRTVGGPSVRPPQPSEYASLTYANSAKWQVSAGGNRYRRGIYTFFQRTSPYPMLMTFDSPDSTACIAQRASSNTPLQALTLWNDPVFFECAQALGRRILSESPDDASSRIDHAFRICLARSPRPKEAQALLDVYHGQKQIAVKDPKAAAALVGGLPTPPDVDRAELSAWIMVGRVLLNLDEFITKE